MRQTLRFVFMLMMLGLLNPFTFASVAGEPPSLADIRAAIKEKGASWVARLTAVSHVPLEQLCGAGLEFEKEVYEEPSPPSDFEDVFPKSAPVTLDWRNYNGHDWTTPIRDQNPCGSCYIFASAAAAEAAMKVQAGTYGYLANPDLSVQFILSCNPSSTCGGNTLTTWASCPLPTTLNGNQNTTYLNFAGINNGSESAPPFGTYWYLDGVHVGWANLGKVGIGGGFYVADLGTIFVRGGRHTVGIDLDINDQVWETNETSGDNKAYRQFAWSPYALPDDTSVTRSSPPKKDSYGAPTTTMTASPFSSKTWVPASGGLRWASSPMIRGLTTTSTCGTSGITRAASRGSGLAPFRNLPGAALPLILSWLTTTRHPQASTMPGPLIITKAAAISGLRKPRVFG